MRCERWRGKHYAAKRVWLPPCQLRLASAATAASCDCRQLRLPPAATVSVAAAGQQRGVELQCDIGVTSPFSAYLPGRSLTGAIIILERAITTPRGATGARNADVVGRSERAMFQGDVSAEINSGTRFLCSSTNYILCVGSYLHLVYSC